MLSRNIRGRRKGKILRSFCLQRADNRLTRSCTVCKSAVTRFAYRRVMEHGAALAEIVHSERMPETVQRACGRVKAKPFA